MTINLITIQQVLANIDVPFNLIENIGRTSPKWLEKLCTETYFTCKETCVLVGSCGFQGGFDFHFHFQVIEVPCTLNYLSAMSGSHHFYSQDHLVKPAFELQASQLMRSAYLKISRIKPHKPSALVQRNIDLYNCSISLPFNPLSLRQTNGL